MRLGANDVVYSALVALDSAADVLVFTPAVPCRLVRFGYTVGVLLDNTATPLILSLDTIVLSGATRTERRLITRTAVDEAIGIHIYEDVSGSTVWNYDSFDDFIVGPGQQAVIEVKQAAVAGDGYVFLEYTPMSYINATTQIASTAVNFPTKAS